MELNEVRTIRKVIINLGAILTRLSEENADMRDGSVYDAILTEMKKLQSLVEGK